MTIFVGKFRGNIPGILRGQMAENYVAFYIHSFFSDMIGEYLDRHVEMTKLTKENLRKQLTSIESFLDGNEPDLEKKLIERLSNVYSKSKKR